MNNNQLIENFIKENDFNKGILEDSKINSTEEISYVIDKNGFYKNDENVLAITSPTIAEFYRDYYLYLFNSIDNKYLHYFPRAESFESKNSCYDGIDNNFDGKIDAEDDGCK